MELQSANLQLLGMVFVHLHLRIFVPDCAGPPIILCHQNSTVIPHPADLLDRCRPLFVSLVLRNHQDLLQVLIEVLYQNHCLNSLGCWTTSGGYHLSSKHPLLPAVQLFAWTASDILWCYNKKIILGSDFNIQGYHCVRWSLLYYSLELCFDVQPVLQLSWRRRSQLF